MHCRRISPLIQCSLDLKDLNRPSRAYDPFNGRKAIKDRVIEATNPEIFRIEQSEHALLRAVSMAQHIEGTIHPKTVQLIRRDAAMIHRSRPYRVKRELERILHGANAGKWIGFLQSTGILRQIFPRMHTTTPHNLKRNLKRKYKG